MYFKCELLVGGYSYNVTNDLVNWDDVELSYKRSDYDGIVRSFSTKFQFANGAYSLLLDQYEKNYLTSAASIVFYKRNNSWLWNEVFRCALDYSTFTHNGLTCDINAVDDSLASIIKAKKGTQYEYSVNEIKEKNSLYYDRMVMDNTSEWIISGDIIEDPGGDLIENTFSGDNADYVYPLYIRTSEIAIKDKVEIGDVQKKIVTDTYDKGDYFFENISDEAISVSINMNFTLWVKSKDLSLIYFDLVHINKKKELLNSIYHIRLDKESSDNYIYNKIEFSTEGYAVQPGWALQLRLSVRGVGTASIYQQKPFLTDEVLKIEFKLRGNPINIDVIKPSMLLNRLLKSMNGGKDGITGNIVSGFDKRLDNSLIVAAESARGITGAKLYSSYTKYCNWMSSEFGFVPVIEGTSVSFVHRSSLFQDKQSKNLGDKCTDFEYNVNSSLIYSRLRVGYDKQDYDSVNGRDEFRFTNEYTTGITLTDNSMELTSPYRADAYGIEFLAAKRGEDTTDSESDNDVFFVCAELSGLQYKLVRGEEYVISGVISPDTMFNVMYSQRFMIEANKSFIASFANAIVYASSEGNSDITINGISEKSDIFTGSSLFTVGELAVETGDTDIPADLSGYVTVEKNGKTYKGYVKSIKLNVGKSKSVKYILIVKSVE